nr:MAG TPA: hypothetical protein [Bacteriophage sp.]
MSKAKSITSRFFIKKHCHLIAAVLLLYSEVGI